MGLFSGKTKISVSSVAYNIAGEAASRSNFLKQSLIYLNAAEESVGEKLPRMYLQSLGMKLKKAYKYAATLPQGLPTASVELWEYQEFEDAVQAMLDVEHGIGKYKVTDAYLTQGNTAPAIENYLNSRYGWDSISGLMVNPPAGFASDADVTWTHFPPQNRFGDLTPQVSRTYRIEFRHVAGSAEADLSINVSLDTINNFQSSLLVVLVAKVMESVRSDSTITRAFQAGDVAGTVTTPVITESGSRVTTTTTTVTTTTDGTTTSIRTRIVDASTSEAVSREYVLGTGAWPSLDTLWNNRNTLGNNFFPSIPFRVENEDMLKETLSGTDPFKQTVKLCKLMGMDARQIRDQINDNESVKDIDYAFLVAGANMNTESQAEMEYLFRFWEMCLTEQTNDEGDLSAWEMLAHVSRAKPKTNSLVIQDPESKNGAYKVTIEWDYVKKVLVTGEVSPGARVGQLAMARGTDVTYEYTSKRGRSMMDSTIVSIRRQVTPTQYEELQISGAIHKNDVYKGKTVETLAKDARSDPEEHEGFLIPLHMGIFNTLSLRARTQLAQECIYMVFNCYVKTKQKWYETSAFKWLLTIIIIVVVIFTMGAASGAGAGAIATVWGAGALVAMGVSAALANIIMSMVIGYMVSYLLGRWSAGFVSVFGEKWAGVVMAVIAITVSAYSGGSGFSSANWLQTAVQIIDVASQLFTSYAKGVMLTRQKEFDAFQDQAEEDKKLLEQLSSEFFGENDLVSIDYLLRLQKTLREDSPTTFLSRTLMTGSDVVDITLGQISEMVTLQTTPRLEGVFL